MFSHSSWARYQNTFENAVTSDVDEPGSIVNTKPAVDKPQLALITLRVHQAR
jgi:hypothetical protein